MCPISPKGEARTHGPHAPLVPKVKLGHLNPICHRVLILRKLSTWVGFNYPPRIGLKDTEPRVASVSKAKLGHTDYTCHWSQRRSQDTQTTCAIGPKAKLGHTNCVCHWCRRRGQDIWTAFGQYWSFVHFPGGVSCKVVTRTLPKIQRNIMLCTITSGFWPELQ